MQPFEISIVIPVYNSADSVRRVALDIAQNFSGVRYELILVNDGSKDASEASCNALAEEFPHCIKFIQLAKNFGEHNAVLCGLNYSTGDYVGVLDDDGQNPPSELRRLYEEIKKRNCDVMYGKYEVKQHHWFRNTGSKLNDKMANVMLKKPAHLYLSSFKVMNRFIVDQIIRYKGAFPYIDGLIFRTTQNIDQIPVQHKPRETGKSNYTLKRLIKLWLDMFLNFSILPLRFSAILGVISSIVCIFLMIGIVVDKITDPTYPVGLPSILMAVVLFASLQLVMLGVIGEYLGRLFLDSSQTPQFSVRYIRNPTTKK